MASDAKGKGQIFWREKNVAPAFFRDRSKPFDVHHDGQNHDYTVTFTAKNSVTGIRIDPSTSQGEIRISSIRLNDVDGKLLHQWRF
jgi:hypothetical protein